MPGKAAVYTAAECNKTALKQQDIEKMPRVSNLQYHILVPVWININNSLHCSVWYFQAGEVDCVAH